MAAERDRVFECTNCGQQFRPRANAGAYGCRIHPGREVRMPLVSDPDTYVQVFTCCGYRRSDMGPLVSESVTKDEYKGCTTADHCAGAYIGESPLCVVPIFLCRKGLMKEPSRRAIVATVDGPMLAKAVGPQGQRVVSVPMPAGTVRPGVIDLVEAAKGVLRNFAQSEFYGAYADSDCRAYTEAFEKHIMKRELSSSAWDVGTSLGRQDELTADRERSEIVPYNTLRHTPSARIIALDRTLARPGGDAEIVKAVIPFYVVRRVDVAPSALARLHFAEYYCRTPGHATEADIGARARSCCTLPM